MGDLKECYQTKNIGFISTCLAGTDGVSLETNKWADVFESEGCHMKPEKLIEPQAGCHTQILNFFTANLFLMAIGILAFWSAVISPSVFASEPLINCEAHKGVCSQSLGNRTISLEITPRPVKAMQDLIFIVHISGPPLSKNPYMDLGMPAMKMGPNRVLLKPTGNGFYEGKGVIVKCPSGRQTWFASITIPESGEVEFIFNVLY